MRSIILPGTADAIVPPFCGAADHCLWRANSAYISSSMHTNKAHLECPEQCARTEFLVKKSSLLAPAPWRLDRIKQFVENSSVPLPLNWFNASHNYISRNYLSISIVRETHLVENNIQRPSLKLIDVLSNIGGQTGLWLGISFLSIMEIFEMLFRLVRSQCLVLCSRCKHLMY